jgi:hypothetical protein
MAQIGNIVAKDESHSGRSRAARRFHSVGDRSIAIIPQEDLKALIKVAYSNGVAAMEWKEAGIILVAEKDVEGNLVVRKSK